jgi:membrane protease YdiL (CAAX protease family)
MTKPASPTTTAGEASLLVTLCFGWFIASSIAAMFQGFPTGDAASGGMFSDDHLWSLIVLELVLGSLALLFLRWRGHNLAELLPTPTALGCLHGVLLFVAATLAWLLVAQAFSSSEHQAQPIAEMAANSRPSLLVVIALSMVNGLYEETFLLGYLVRGFAGAGASLALGISLLVRVLYHLYQGPIGAVSVLVFGLVVSAAYWRTRQLWPVVFAHVLADAVAFA